MNIIKWCVTASWVSAGVTTFCLLTVGDMDILLWVITTSLWALVALIQDHIIKLQEDKISSLYKITEIEKATPGGQWRVMQ